jgi:hypothetical protein
MIVFYKNWMIFLFKEKHIYISNSYNYIKYNCLSIETIKYYINNSLSFFKIK